MAGTKLNEHHQSYLVRAFACYLGPKEAVKGLYETYGITITQQAAHHYNADREKGRKRLGKKWKEMFAQARQAFIDDVVALVPEAQKSVRIRELALAARTFKENKNYIAMARMLEQIAKEVGNVHTNRHEITGKDGGSIKFQDVGDMTDEQINEELERLGWPGADVHPAPETTQ